MKRNSSGIRLLAFLAVIAFGTGCSTAVVKPKIYSPSGFLPDYSILQPSLELAGVQSYIDSSKNLTTYHMVILDEVKVMPTVGNEPVPPQATKHLGSRFSQGVKQALRNGYPVVTKPGYGILKLRMAITNAAITPAQLSPNSPYSGYNLDDAYLEGEFRDSMSGELVAAFVAPQFGLPQDSTWSRVDSNVRTATQLSQWAMILRDRLYEARGLPPSSNFQPQY